MTLRKSIAARQDLVREGDRPAGMYLILEGWATRYRQRADGSRQILAILLPGDLCIDPPHRPLNHAICSLTQVRFGLIPHPRFGGEPGDSPELMDALIARRNANWASWVRTRLDKPGTVMMAVGAGHLAGDASVVKLLQKQGLKVKRVQ